MFAPGGWRGKRVEDKGVMTKRHLEGGNRQKRGPLSHIFFVWVFLVQMYRTVKNTDNKGTGNWMFDPALSSLEDPMFSFIFSIILFVWELG